MTRFAAQIAMLQTQVAPLSTPETFNTRLEIARTALPDSAADVEEFIRELTSMLRQQAANAHLWLAFGATLFAAPARLTLLEPGTTDADAVDKTSSLVESCFPDETRNQYRDAASRMLESEMLRQLGEDVYTYACIRNILTDVYYYYEA